MIVVNNTWQCTPRLAFTPFPISDYSFSVLIPSPSASPCPSAPSDGFFFPVPPDFHWLDSSFIKSLCGVPAGSRSFTAPKCVLTNSENAVAGRSSHCVPSALNFPRNSRRPWHTPHAFWETSMDFFWKRKVSVVCIATYGRTVTS